MKLLSLLCVTLCVFAVTALAIRNADLLNLRHRLDKIQLFDEDEDMGLQASCGSIHGHVRCWATEGCAWWQKQTLYWGVQDPQNVNPNIAECVNIRYGACDGKTDVWCRADPACFWTATQQIWTGSGTQPGVCSRK